MLNKILSLTILLGFVAISEQATCGQPKSQEAITQQGEPAPMDCKLIPEDAADASGTLSKCY